MAAYPRTVLEFRDWFADDAACRDYLVRLRWPDGFRCPKCRAADHWVTARGLRHCRHRGRQPSTDGRLAGVWRTGPAGVSLLKRWLLGTHQGAVSAEHLDYYLDEYTFRFNR